jgi:hypothetical protein
VAGKNDRRETTPKMKAKITCLIAGTALMLSPAAFGAATQKSKKTQKDQPVAACCEDAKGASKSAKGDCACTTVEKRVVLTGSHIPQRVKRHGRITTGVSPVVILSAEDIANTGESDVGAALRKLVPSFH